MLDWWCSLDITNINEAGQSPFGYSCECLRMLCKKEETPSPFQLCGGAQAFAWQWWKEAEVSCCSSVPWRNGDADGRGPFSSPRNSRRWDRNMARGQGQPRTQGETHSKPTHLLPHQPANQEDALLPSAEAIATSLLFSPLASDNHSVRAV